MEVFIDDFDITSYIAECYYNLTDYEETLVWYKRALEVKPGDDTIISYMSDVYSILEDYDNAKNMQMRLFPSIAIM